MSHHLPRSLLPKSRTDHSPGFRKRLSSYGIRHRQTLRRNGRYEASLSRKDRSPGRRTQRTPLALPSPNRRGQDWPGSGRCVRRGCSHVAEPSRPPPAPPAVNAKHMPPPAVSSAGRGSIPPVLGPVAAWKEYLPGREIQARADHDPGGRDLSDPSQDAASGCLKNSAGFNSRQYGSTGDARTVSRPELRFK